MGGILFISLMKNNSYGQYWPDYKPKIFMLNPVLMPLNRETEPLSGEINYRGLLTRQAINPLSEQG